MRTGKLDRTVFLVGFSIAACRYRYDLIPVEQNSSTGAAAGNTSKPGVTAGAPTADGGAGTTDPPLDGGGGEETIAGSGSLVDGGAAGEMSVSGGSNGEGGSPGSGGVPPTLALCNQAAYGGHDYLLCQELRNWADANGGCLALGMRLVRVDDAAENQWLFFSANVPTGANGEIWLGATDLDVEGEWRWTDGDLFWLGTNTGTPQNGLFNGWYSREPNNASIENCAALDTKAAGAEWYDLDCLVKKAYVCESL